MMDKACLEKITKSLDQQNKSLEKIMTLLGKLRSLNKTSKEGRPDSIKSFFDSAVVTKMMLTLEGIHEALLKRNK